MRSLPPSQMFPFGSNCPNCQRIPRLDHSTICIFSHIVSPALPPHLISFYMHFGKPALEILSSFASWIEDCGLRIRVNRSAIERFLDKRCFMFLLLPRKPSDNLSTHGTVQATLRNAGLLEMTDNYLGNKLCCSNSQHVNEYA